MIILVKKWKLDKNDHSWLAESDAHDYIENSTCPMCNSNMNDIAIVVNSRGDVGLKTSLCPLCGFIKKSRNLSGNWYNDHFKKFWLKKRINEKVVEDRYIFDRLSPFLPKKAQILDVGCGQGERLMPFSKAGHGVCGIDPSINRSKKAGGNIGNIYNTTAEQYFIESNNLFDLIYFYNVLQFIENPSSVISMAAEKLKKGGKLFIRTGHFSKANYCHLSHLGLMRSAFNLYALKDLFCKLNLFPVLYSESPFEILLKKDIEEPISNEIILKAKKTSEPEIRSFVKRSLKFNKLKFFGQSSISYQKRELVLKRLSKFDNSLPITFYHNQSYLPILLK